MQHTTQYCFPTQTALSSVALWYATITLLQHVTIQGRVHNIYT